MGRWAPALLLLAAPAVAQDAPAPPAPPDDLVFEDVEQRMTVPVSLAGAGPYRFIIDTGAQRTVISRELARRLDLPRGRSVRIMAMTGPSEVGTVVIPSLSVSSVSGTRIEAPELEGRHLGAAGLLGIDTLQGHAVAIDFDRNRMAVTRSAKRKRSRPARSDEIVVQARSLFGQLVVTDATYRGVKVRVVLDTGSAVTMGNEALRRRVEKRHKAQAIELTSVTGDTLTAGYTQIDQVKIGSVTFLNLPVAFSDVPPFRQFGLENKPAILLGMDALRQFRHVSIDFANREVRLQMPRRMARG